MTLHEYGNMYIVDATESMGSRTFWMALILGFMPIALDTSMAVWGPDMVSIPVQVSYVRDARVNTNTTITAVGRPLCHFRVHLCLP